jgi:hypothetical protein
MWPATAIVVMSGLMEAPGLDSLCAARICKPFELDHLQDVLSHALGHGPAIRDTERPPAARTEPSPPPDAYDGDDDPDTNAETPDAKKSQPPPKPAAK